MITEIVPNLYVGDRYAAEALGAVVPANWRCICVQGATSVPFMAWPMPKRRQMLDAISVEIQVGLAAGKRVLVHCVQGRERSPLAIAWHLVRTGRVYNLDAAYDAICMRHPVTERCMQWVSSEPPVRA